jgi:hypothetical protein
MLGLVLCAQIVSATLIARADTVYATDALRDLVAQAAIANHAPPPAFRGYTARVETELALAMRDTLGRERTAQVEQLAADAAWARGGRYDLHVIGFRSQSVGVPYSTLSIVRGWTVPSLYGERLQLGADFQQSTRRPASGSGRRSNDFIAVHPFAQDRDRFYRFSGGDTVAVLRVGERSVPIARIHVTPQVRDSTRFGAFDGEIDLDASRRQIVRMRGQFVILGGERSAHPFVARLSGITAVAYVEFVNAEVSGAYWLPAIQRTEFQAQIALLGNVRSVFRLVSHFSDYHVDAAGFDQESDGTTRRIAQLTWAPDDSIGRFGDWRTGLGVASSSVQADDFADIAPDSWRTTGASRVDFIPVRTADVVRFNRVEGLYTGAAARLEFRDLAPGLSGGAFGGWAWSEGTVRGGLRVGLARDPWHFALRAERSLATTNDFVPPLEGGGGLAALLGTVDDLDYLDRRIVAVSTTRIFGGVDRALGTIQLGYGQDAAERSRLARGLFGGAGGFRPNRGSAGGRYALVTTDIEIHPNVTGDFVQPGFGARAHYEGATGGLRWQRLEVSLSARRYLGPLTVAAHADGGGVVSRGLPPQQLFELGGASSLPGYEYKEFAGDRAAIFRSFASYRLRLWHTPRRIFRTLYLPPVAPGIGVRAAGGWTELSSDAARAAVLALGDGWSDVPISRPTAGVRATVGAGLTLFSDLVNVGFVRAVDHAAPWRFVVGFGPRF